MDSSFLDEIESYKHQTCSNFNQEHDGSG
jgi:hypothetical protein